MNQPMSTIQKLSKLIQNLETNGDPTRLYAARAAYNFKHSWLDMAQALVEVENSGKWTEWGYDNFLAYCNAELGLKRAVVDKLIVSFHTLQQHAPQRLENMDEETPIPSCQSLDYYARALNAPRLNGASPKDGPSTPMSPELNGQLYQAVFDEGCTPKQLKERFDPLIRPKPPAKEQLDATKKAASTARKLLEQLEELEGLSQEAMYNAEQALGRLTEEMDVIIEQLSALLTEEN